MIIIRRPTLFCKLAVLWAVIGFSKIFTVTARKCDYDGKHQKTRSKRRFRDLENFFSKLQIFWFVTELSDIFTVRA